MSTTSVRPLIVWATTRVAAAAVAPAVVFVAAFNNIVFRNSADLLYHWNLTTAFFTAFLGSWVLLATAFLSADRSRAARVLSRCAILAALTVLVFDAVRPWLDNPTVPVALAIPIEVVVLTALGVGLARVRFAHLATVGAVTAILIVSHGVVGHYSFVRNLPPSLVKQQTPRVYRPHASSLPQGNVYHLVLDAFQSETFEHLRDRLPDLEFEFDYYRRFNTNYSQTATALPAMLRGRFLEPNGSFREWHYAAPAEGFWDRLASAGATLSLYPYIPYFCLEKAYDCLSAVHPAVTTDTILSATVIDLWFLSIVPNSIRRILNGPALTTGQPFVGTEETTGFSITALWGQGITLRAGALLERVRHLVVNQVFGFAQFNQLLAEERRRPANGQYVFYHGMIPHGPYSLDEDCRFEEPEAMPADTSLRGEIFSVDPNAGRYMAFATCAMKMITMLTNRLKEVGHYADALIIVQADHGDHALLRETIPGLDLSFALDPIAETYQPVDHWYLNDANWEELRYGDSAQWRSVAVEVSSSGLLLVKPPHAVGGRDRDVPVQMIDIAPTILRHFDLPTDDLPGLPIENLRDGQDRENVFFTHGRYTGAEGFPGKKLSKYRLTSDGWTFVTDLPVVDDQ